MSARHLKHFRGSLIALSLSVLAGSWSAAQNGGGQAESPQGLQRVPEGVILVKGAWYSSSDAVTPTPEGGKVTASGYDSAYFNLSYPLASGWRQKYEGPPPSESGYYVLAELSPASVSKEGSRGTLMIGAQDMFFTPVPARNALEVVNFTKARLKADYVVERQPAQVSVAGHSFVRLDYYSPGAALHWSLLATQIRCHTVTFNFMSPDPKLIAILIDGMNAMKLPVQAGLEAGTNGGGDVPLCLGGYASGSNVLNRVDPIFTERRYNAVPVRVIIGTDGKIKHIHFLSAFPEQAKAVTDALQQWRFKPYLSNGKPVEVETGILFGRVPADMAVAKAVKQRPQ
jgi:hypothetical protein